MPGGSPLSPWTPPPRRSATPRRAPPPPSAPPRARGARLAACGPSRPRWRRSRQFGPSSTSRPARPPHRPPRTGPRRPRPGAASCVVRARARRARTRPRRRRPADAEPGAAGRRRADPRRCDRALRGPAGPASAAARGVPRGASACSMPWTDPGAGRAVPRTGLDADAGARRATGRVRIRWAGDSALARAAPRRPHPRGGSHRGRAARVRHARDPAPPHAKWRSDPGRSSRAAAFPRWRPRRLPSLLGEQGALPGLRGSSADAHAQNSSVVDWNRDDRPDLIATRTGESSLVFLNDGSRRDRGGPSPSRSGRAPGVRARLRPRRGRLDDSSPASALYDQGSSTGVRRTLDAHGRRADRTGGTSTRPSQVPNAVTAAARASPSRPSPFDVEARRANRDSARSTEALLSRPPASTWSTPTTAPTTTSSQPGGLQFTEESDARGITGTRYAIAKDRRRPRVARRPLRWNDAA